MNKIWIGLLIIGAAAGAFFYLRKQEKTNPDGFKKEWIVGKWTIDSLHSNSNDSAQDLVKTGILPDSNYRQYRYEFFDDGRIVKAGSDSAHTYTLQYNWEKEKPTVFTWKKNSSDSNGVSLQVITLVKDSLVVEAGDKGKIWFIKTK